MGRGSWLPITVLLCLAALALGTVLSPHRTPTPAPRVRPASGATTSRFAVPVLMYHHVAHLTRAESASRLLCDLTVSPEDFDDQIRYLAEHGFTFLHARDVERAVHDALPLPCRAVAITFDDGYKDSVEYAFPILQEQGATATIYIVTSTAGTQGHLGWDDIRRMHEAGIEFGSHGVHHLDLRHLTDVQLDRELRESRRIIEEEAKGAVRSIAYPAGEYNQTVIDHVKEAGYRGGWKKSGGPARPSDNPYELPRVRVHGTTTIEEFARLVSQDAAPGNQ
jgi:peptidoglycan/xylan/chitin deacetylase (PgdA/CDA1 family)